MGKYLLRNISSDATGDSIVTLGGFSTIAVYATNFGGGKVTIELSVDGSTWIPLDKDNSILEFTENKVYYFTGIGQGLLIRAKLTGSTGASNVNVYITS